MINSLFKFQKEIMHPTGAITDIITNLNLPFPVKTCSIQSNNTTQAVVSNNAPPAVNNNVTVFVNNNVLNLL